MAVAVAALVVAAFVCVAVWLLAPVAPWARAREGLQLPPGTKATKGPYAWTYAANKKVIDAADAAGTPFDLLLYGDSITYHHAYVSKVPWQKHFGSLRAAALGVPGDTTWDLAWRMQKNGEVPRLPPKALAIMIGVNNQRPNTLMRKRHMWGPEAHSLKLLLKWLKARYPTTKIILMAVLPEAVGADYTTKNAVFKNAAAEAGVMFASCGQGIDPKDKTLMPDGLHPSDAGHDVVLSCLAGML